MLTYKGFQYSPEKPPLPCHLWWARDLTLSLTSCSTPDTGTCTSLGQHNRTDRIDRSEVELPWEYDRGRSDSSPHLPYGGMGREMPSLPAISCCLWLVAELALRSEELENCPCPSEAATWESDPYTPCGQLSSPQCLNMGELILRV